MTRQAGIFGPISSSVTLDASGNGTTSFQATGQNVTITNMSVRVSTAIKEATATVYKGQIGTAYRLSGSVSASTGDSNNDEIYMADGETIYVQFTGGDVGATATVTLSGTASIPGGGFRAMG